MLPDVPYAIIDFFYSRIPFSTTCQRSTRKFCGATTQEIEWAVVLLPLRNRSNSAAVSNGGDRRLFRRNYDKAIQVHGLSATFSNYLRYLRDQYPSPLLFTVPGKTTVAMTVAILYATS
uniref:Neur_chan_LBD domain-containing protein n=1 Tax=Steinernema glaseri TaxID=37863 RepID=A0A1I7ZMJ6_9BILA